jgi:hypothetical protein
LLTNFVEIRGKNTSVMVGLRGDAKTPFKDAMGICLGHDTLYVADRKSNCVQAFGLDGTFLKEWGVREPLNIAADEHGTVAVQSGDDDRTVTLFE